MRPELVQRLLQRFPSLRDLKAEAEEARREEERRHQEEVQKAQAEGKKPPARVESHVPVYPNPTFLVPKEDLLEVCTFLRDDPEFRMDYLSFVSAVDRPPDSLEVVYHLFSTEHRHNLLLKVVVPREDPRVPSVVGIWDGANWHERETYDLLGVIFEGHPNLRRIMMTEDWTGHPLRKDYVYEDPAWLVELARQRQQEIAATGGEPIGERA